MNATTESHYETLEKLWRRSHHLTHLQRIAIWDQAANMPAKGNEARAAALAEIATSIHDLLTDPSVETLLSQAAQETLEPSQKGNLREMKRLWQLRNALPASLVRRKDLAVSRCEHAWRTQRPANDWQGFLANFEEVLSCTREEADRLSQALGVSKYEALMSRYEPGLTTVTVDRLFGELKTWLPGLIQEVTKRQGQEVTIQPQGPFQQRRQKVLCEQVMRLLGFDFEAGRLDVSTHPFCGGVPEDVRMTTRFKNHEFITSLFGTIHETGHGRYDQNRPREWLGQPASNARSMAIHESQSLFFEMQLGCHPGFLANLSPLIIEAFGYQNAFEPQALAHLLTRVKPSLIRVDADEVTYPAHIMLRYEIERQLIEGDIEAVDIPSLWDAQMSSLLNVDTRGNYKDGPLQDVHWPTGAFGYFPCYSIGAMYAAQWFASIEKAMPNVHKDIEHGNLQPIWDWLNENIWQNASFLPTVELTQKASGSELDLRYFKRHLYKRYLGETL
ncbi:carboxypeptidase M32 [Limnohabitans sp. 2KL-51]|uniref:carboxypeptidase M32 n=1 Tax=Limnohabitans sp. 2KL-51 TaxID=1977911 RepID=UPI000D34149A|nr:carboxypeptidase M32 [Limnohabitans sp. 2KL-51]PUE44359.1 carboxypeptidase M32 [Limnohabitans sp. 2KL-51]